MPEDPHLLLLENDFSQCPTSYEYVLNVLRLQADQTLHDARCPVDRSDAQRISQVVLEQSLGTGESNSVLVGY